jgi:hypothetical protein
MQGLAVATATAQLPTPGGRGERKRHRTIDFDGGEPAATTFTPLLPATNTVRFGGADGTTLRLPVSAASSP